MSPTLQSAWGASAFTTTDRSFFSCMVGGVPAISEAEEGPAQIWAQWIDELHRIRNLEDNWDGEGTEAPHPSLVDAALTLAQHLEARGYPPAERVVASVNGTIYFEWHTPLEYQEIEVISPLHAECRTVPKGSDETKVVVLSWRS